MGSEQSRTHMLEQYREFESKSMAAYERWMTTTWKMPNEVPESEGSQGRTMDIHQLQTANCLAKAPVGNMKTDDELHEFLEEMEAHGAAMCRTASRFFSGGTCSMGHGTTFNIHQDGSITSIIPIYQGGYRIIRKYRDGKFLSESRRLVKPSEIK